MITGFYGGSSIAGYHVVSVSIESCDSGYLRLCNPEIMIGHSPVQMIQRYWD